MHCVSNPPCKKIHATQTLTQALEVQALGQQSRVEAKLPLMTSKDESCEEVPALTPFLAAPKQQTRVAAWNVIENLHVLSCFV